jgi:uncharacterized protein with HEPN domain
MQPDEAWLNDILSAAREILDHIGGMDRALFMVDLKTQRAVDLAPLIAGIEALEI